MKTIKITIEGKTPLMLHRFTSKAQESASQGERTVVRENKSDTPREVAEQFLYIGKKGIPIIPQSMLFACFMFGGKFFKIGRNKVTTTRSSVLPAYIAIEELEIPIRHKEPWEVDTRAVCIPASQGRVLQHRPKFHDWKLSFTVEIDETSLTLKLFRDIVDMAGRAAGLGAFRPGVKGMFGKFVVTSWKVL